MNVIQTRVTLTECVDLISQLPNQQDYRNVMAKARNIDVSILDNMKCFYVESVAELEQAIGDKVNIEELGLLSNYTEPLLGMFDRAEKQTPLSYRFSYPIRDIDGYVAGIQAYSSDSYIRYLRTKTLGFNKSNMIMGMENYDKILRSDYVIVTEGTVDYLSVLLRGYSIISLGGTYVPKFIIDFLKRLSLVIIIADSDSSGSKMNTFLRKVLPNSVSYYIKSNEKVQTISGMSAVKDLDNYINTVDGLHKWETQIKETIRLSKLLIYKDVILT